VSELHRPRRSLIPAVRSVVSRPNSPPVGSETQAQASDVDLVAEFSAAAKEIGAEFRRRISGLRRRFRPSDIPAALKSAREWRSAAMEALRRNFAGKRSAAKTWRNAASVIA
jgi:hypothetical protein